MEFSIPPRAVGTRKQDGRGAFVVYCFFKGNDLRHYFSAKRRSWLPDDQIKGVPEDEYFYSTVEEAYVIAGLFNPEGIEKPQAAE